MARWRYYMTGTSPKGKRLLEEYGIVANSAVEARVKFKRKHPGASDIAIYNKARPYPTIRAKVRVKAIARRLSRR